MAADAPAPKRLKLLVRDSCANLVDLGVSLFRHYPRRAVLGLVLMASQAFCYNAIFFTYALVLDRFFHVPAERVGWYLLPVLRHQLPGASGAGMAVRSLGTAADDQRLVRHHRCAARR